MAINFPTSPAVNDTYTYIGKSWKWNGDAWQKTDPTETGNTEGNTGEVAYYGVKGSVIKGATGFLYDDSTHGISAYGDATVGGIILKGTTANNFITFADGSTQGTRHGIEFRLDGEPLVPTDYPHRYLDFSGDATQVDITSLAQTDDTAELAFTLGSDAVRKSLNNVYTNNYNVAKVTGSKFFCADTEVEALLALTENAAATYMGITATAFGNQISFKSKGDVFQLTPDSVHAFQGISADRGATFGGDVNFKGNILLPDDGFIGVGAGDERIIFDSNGNDITLSTNTVYFPNKLSHNGDTDTYIAFTTDNVSLQAGGTDVLNITSSGANFGDNEVQRPKLKDYAETVYVGGSKSASFTVDFEEGNVQTYALTDDLTIDFENPPASGIAGTVTLIILNGGANTTTWDSAVKWPGDNAPALTSSGVDILSFMTIDAGTTIYGFVGGINFS